MWNKARSIGEKRNCGHFNMCIVNGLKKDKAHKRGNFMVKELSNAAHSLFIFLLHTFPKKNNV